MNNYRSPYFVNEELRAKIMDMTSVSIQPTRVRGDKLGQYIYSCKHYQVFFRTATAEYLYFMSVPNELSKPFDDLHGSVLDSRMKLVLIRSLLMHAHQAACYNYTDWHDYYRANHNEGAPTNEIRAAFEMCLQSYDAVRSLYSNILCEPGHFDPTEKLVNSVADLFDFG